MPKTKEDHKATFENSMAKKGRFRTKISTGMDWPDNIWGRRYSLVVQAVTDDTVTLQVTSADIDPRGRREGYNPLEHGDVEVLITDDIDEIVRTGVHAADPDFFEKHTPVPNREDFEHMRVHGIKYSKGYRKP